MPTPKKGYSTLSGEKVPGTTTVIGRFKDSGPLMFWAFDQGRSGAEKLYDAAEKAADIGTCAHAMVEAHIHNASDSAIDEIARSSFPDKPDWQEKAKSSYLSYRSWQRNFKVEIQHTELYLVSERYKYGGTLDAIGEIDGARVLLDWKTSNGVYVDYLIQLAAYENLWNENHPEQPINGGMHLLRFSKEHGDFAHHYYPNLDDAFKQFLLFRQAWDLDKELKKRAK